MKLVEIYDTLKSLQTHPERGITMGLNGITNNQITAKLTEKRMNLWFRYKICFVRGSICSFRGGFRLWLWMEETQGATSTFSMEQQIC